MSGKRRLLIILALFLLINPLKAFEGYSGSRLIKEYVSADEIVVNEDGLFIFVQGELMPVAGIAKDEDGLYAVGVRTEWKCPYCKWVNQWYHTRCQNPACRR